MGKESTKWRKGKKVNKNTCNDGATRGGRFRSSAVSHGTRGLRAVPGKSDEDVTCPVRGHRGGGSGTRLGRVSEAVTGGTAAAKKSESPGQLLEEGGGHDAGEREEVGDQNNS